MENLPIWTWGFPMGDFKFFSRLQPYVSDIGSSKHKKSVEQKKKEIAKRRKKNKGR